LLAKWWNFSALWERKVENRGMRKKTAAEKFASGDSRKIGARKLAAQLAAEPKVESGLPEVSPRLRGDAQTAFAFYRAQLVQSRMAAQVDVYALERACVALAQCWRADRALQREGAVIRTPIMAGRGFARKRVGWRQSRNKWFAVRLESEKAFRIFANQFGLVGPVSRSGMEVSHSKLGPNEDLMKLLLTPRKPRIPSPEEVEWQAKQAREAQEAKPKEPPPEPVRAN
jgi:Phage terminase, small subunit